MKKQMSMDTTDAFISDVETNHRCVIQKDIPSEKTHKKTESLTLVANGGSAGGSRGASMMYLPYHSIFFVNDNEFKLGSGQKITTVVGDLAQQTVYLDGILFIAFHFKFCSMWLFHYNMLRSIPFCQTEICEPKECIFCMTALLNRVSTTAEVSFVVNKADFLQFVDFIHLSG